MNIYNNHKGINIVNIKKKLVVFFFFLFFCASVFPASKAEYILRPGDGITISVIDHPEFTLTASIRPDAMINYPVVGDIEVGGLTIAQLVKIMEEKLSPYVNNVVVSVSIDSYFSNKIYILGDVGSSGQYTIFEPIDVLKALAISGGLKNAKTKLIKIVRADGDIIVVDLEVFFSTKGAAQDDAYLLYPGDTMFVPVAWQIPWAMYTTIVSVLNLTFALLFNIMNLAS